MAAAVDRFIDMRPMSDVSIAKMARDLRVDIAVDLKGYTQDSRPGIFAARAAPVQVNYLGYPGTMAAPNIEYLIADRIIIPSASREHYSEAVAYLPECYQVNDNKRAIADRQFTRAEMGLPDDGFVFCSFNNIWKITPTVFDAWMRILKRVEGSVLWLLEDNPVATENLEREAQRRGIDPQRLVFGKRLPLAEHLARHSAADLFLDTLPCNAHATASDALWSGLPVLTCEGRSFPARVAASLLHAIRLPELVATGLAEYETLAVELAADRSKLEAIREKLVANRAKSPLFDTTRSRRAIEAAYRAMYDRHRAGLSPVDIDVTSDALPAAGPAVISKVRDTTQGAAAV